MLLYRELPMGITTHHTRRIWYTPDDKKLMKGWKAAQVGVAITSCVITESSNNSSTASGCDAVPPITASEKEVKSSMLIRPKRRCRTRLATCCFCALFSAGMVT